MITENEVFKIGKLLKPHGIKGEINFAFDNDVFDRSDCPYLICLTEGIFVPFFIEEYRFRGKDTALIKFEGVDSDNAARRLSNTEVYFPRSYFEEKEDDGSLDYSWNYFLGFTAIDNQTGKIGVIEDIDDSTMNVLFIIRNEEDEILLIPCSEDFITEIDSQEKIIKMNLPEGLIDSIR